MLAAPAKLVSNRRAKGATKGDTPMPKDFEVVDERFRHMILGNAWVEKLHGGMLWAEGPVWFADGQYLLWSDIPNNVILQYCEGAGVRVYRHPSNNTNGHTRDREGRLISCEHRGRRVSRTELDGSVTVLADRYKGKRLNSPTTSSSSPTARSGSPIRPTAS